MEVRLKVLVGKNAGQELSLPGPRFLIGRAEDCQLRPSSDLISRHHCVLLVEEDYLAVRDFGSKNGTIVNDVRVVGECELKAGDRLTVGPLEFQIVVNAAAAAKKRPPVQSIKEAAVRTAGAAGNTQDLDVGEWISQEGAAAASETRRLALHETNEIDAESIASEGAEDSGEAEHGTTAADLSGVHGKGSSGKHKPGKLPPVPKHSKRDSREAAADVLNKFFRRR